MSIGHKGALAATDIIARMALDLLTDEHLRTEARVDLEHRRADYRFVSTLPPSQRHPIDLPDWLVADGSAEAIADLAQTT
jgi:hypothetical protein